MNGIDYTGIIFVCIALISLWLAARRDAGRVG